MKFQSFYKFYFILSSIISILPTNNEKKNRRILLEKFIAFILKYSIINFELKSECPKFNL